MEDYPLLAKLLCVALVASVMLPAGPLIFPLVDTAFDSQQFRTIEALVSAGLGAGLYAAVFG